MNTANDINALVGDLAGYWTEPALEILKATGVGPISVDMEIEAWRTLKQVLHSEFRLQDAFRLSTLVSLSRLMEKVLCRAAVLVAQKLGLDSVSYDFECRVRQLAGEQPPTAAERRLYSVIVRQPAMLPAPKPPRRKDFTPQLRVSAIGG